MGKPHAPSPTPRPNPHSTTSHSPPTLTLLIPAAEEQAQLATAPLGKAGVVSPSLIFGTMTLTTSGESGMGMGVADRSTSLELLDRAHAAGSFFFDTADAYNGGESETVIGEWLAGKEEESPGFRESVMVATKCFFPSGLGANNKGLSRTHVLNAVDGSLSRLGTEYIDVLILHCFDVNTPLEETLGAIGLLLDQGKIRYWGVSNFAGFQLQAAVDLCVASGMAKPVVAQHQYSLLMRSIEWEVLPVCRAHGIALMAWSPLASGWLTGRFTRETEAPPQDSRVNWNANISFTGLSWDALANEHTWGVVDALAEIAAELGQDVTLAQVAIRWLIQRTQSAGVSIFPIIGARKMEHLNDNLLAGHIELSDAHMERLTSASACPLPYPYSFLAAMGGQHS